jgi:ribonucleoside-diphosphate reductase alpha chain
MHGPKVLFSDQLHAQKYRGEGESFREAINRVSSALSDDTTHFKALRNILLNMRFLPAGRVQAAMGSTKIVTPYNCFLSGIIEDSFVDGSGSIMARALEAAATMRMGGGIGYDFSTLRPRGATIKKLQSRSSGPVSFMEIYNAICLCTSSSGHRRGAQMGVMRIDHPDIEEFIRAKQNTDRLRGFNMSVAVTDEFMEHLLSKEPFPLYFGGEIYKEVDPQALWETLMRSTWDWGEPGVLFIDRINEMNNLWYCETIAATNPCGEQPLPPHGACLLGSFNLVKYVWDGGFDLDQFILDVEPVVRAMDNVVDRATYPLFEQEKEAKSKRRMGLGITGLANALEAQGLEYGSAEFCEEERRLLQILRDEAYMASCKLALEKGSFPMLNEERYLQGEFVKTLDEEVRHHIKHGGIRNSHLLSIAPTGTISMTADNVSSGIEPVVAYEVDRTVYMDDEPVVVQVEDYGRNFFGKSGKTVADVGVQEHLDVLATAVPFIDSSISKTCNVTSDTPWEDFKKIYVDAWERRCKGCATFQMGGKREGILNLSCEIDPRSGQKECD